MQRMSASVGLLALLAACTLPAAPDAPQVFPAVIPAPGVAQEGGDVVTDARPLVVRSAQDVAAAYVEGWLPTPCHRPVADLTVLVPARRASIAVGARLQDGDACAQVLTPWAKVYAVGSADLARGAWTLAVDGHALHVPRADAPASPVVIETAERTGEGGGAALVVRGSLPTPCHVLRLSRRVEAMARTLEVRLDAVSDAEACASVLQPFHIVLPLAPAADGWRVLVNGREVR